MEELPPAVQQNRARRLLPLFPLLLLWPQGDRLDWQKAAGEISRLPPAAFKQLPASVINALEHRGCAVPQTYSTAEPHNVIQGAFARKGQKDWAVLCSKEEESTILVFWAEGMPCTNEVAPVRDITFLQEIGQGKIGYSRLISPVEEDFIEEHTKRSGGPKPPPLDHQGINDAFLEKGSSVHYCYEGKWLKLTGAD